MKYGNKDFITDDGALINSWYNGGWLPMTEKEWYWDWIKHEGNIFTNRGNFFLVAESMLLVTVSALVASSNHQSFFLLLSYIGGIFVTLIWLYVNGKHKKTQAIIIKKYKKLCPKYDEIKSQNKIFPWCIPNNTMMGIVLPFGFLVLWIFLLSAFRNPWCKHGVLQELFSALLHTIR